MTLDRHLTEVCLPGLSSDIEREYYQGQLDELRAALPSVDVIQSRDLIRWGTLFKITKDSCAAA